MSDTLKPGVETTEYKLTRFITIAGAALAGLGYVLEALAQYGVGGHYVGLALTLVGVVTALLAKAGYVKERTSLKATAMEQATHRAHIEASLVATLPDALAKLDYAAVAAEAQRDDNTPRS